MFWFSLLTALFLTGIMLWDWNFRHYIRKSISWLRNCQNEFEDDERWHTEAGHIAFDCIPHMEEVEHKIAKRFIPVSVTFCLGWILVVMTYMGLTSIGLTGFVVTGAVFTACEALMIPNTYMKVKVMLRTQAVVIQAKLNYDKEITSPA